MSEFYLTKMGHRFYESTMPKLVRQVARLADNLAALEATLRERSAAPTEEIGASDSRPGSEHARESEAGNERR